MISGHDEHARFSHILYRAVDAMASMIKGSEMKHLLATATSETMGRHLSLILIKLIDQTFTVDVQSTMTEELKKMTDLRAWLSKKNFGGIVLATQSLFSTRRTLRTITDSFGFSENKAKAPRVQRLVRPSCSRCQATYIILGM